MTFDNFKQIEKYWKLIKNDDFNITHHSEKYGTVSYNMKYYMSAAVFYEKYVREYGWDFCEKAAASSPIISDSFLHFCHFYEWKEREDFEFFLSSKGAEDRINKLIKYIPLVNANGITTYIEENKKSANLVEDTLLLYEWLIENHYFEEASVPVLEGIIIEDLEKSTKSLSFFPQIRKITNGYLGIKSEEEKKENVKLAKIELDQRGQQAIALVKKGESLFITGKAGTGKTTLLKEILRSLGKTVAVVAPTGVAAKNASGITIHSFLRLPTSPYFPGIDNPELYGLKKAEEEVVRKVDTIIIDEVSMVRCDVMDAMDDVLRHYRKNDIPFGGVQIVMFGDLFQLMPVAPDEDWEILKKHYDSPYFFSSKAYQHLNCKMLELKKVYRQNESTFITILNNIREGAASLREINILNTRYDSKAKPTGDSIMLTTHNRRAKGYNWDKLQRLSGDIREYKATISGWFPSDERPTSYYLQLKVGAKVMFVKNDTVSHTFYNGMMGVIKKMTADYVEVEAEGKTLIVMPQYWEHHRYIINKETKKMEVEMTGSFVQLPLMLAWAVTIHKSQGLTFDKVLIDAEKAFTFGQVYVALSRCRTFNGITLTTPLSAKAIMADNIVKKFMKETPKVLIDDEFEEEEDIQRKHLIFKDTEDRTLFYINNGLGVDDIVERCGETKAIVLSHIAKLVSKGKVDGRKYVLPTNFDIIVSLFKEHGIESDRKLIRGFAPQVSFGEIEIVRAQLTLSKRAVIRQPEPKPAAPAIVEKNESEVPLVLSIGPKTFDKIKLKKKSSYKKVIYNSNDAKLFFIGKYFKLLNIEEPCPYELRNHSTVKFVSTDSESELEKRVISISIETTEETSNNKRWVANIEFK